MKHIQKAGLLLVFICLINVCNVTAQAGYEDVLYLKNRSIIHGMIIEQIPNQSIKIQTRDRNIFVYKMDEIEKITKESSVLNNSSLSKRYVDAVEIKKNPYSGFSVGVEACVGGGTGSQNKNEGLLAAHAVLGYMYKSIFIVGVSTGLNEWTKHTTNTYSYSSNSDPFISIDASLSFRVFPIRNRFSPYFVGEAGYSFISSNTDNSDYTHTTGGVLFNAGIGARVNLTQKKGMNISLLYKALQLNVTKNVGTNYNYNNTTNTFYTGTYYLEGVCLAVGFSF